MADRPCGDCSACCTYKAINSAELTKAPGVRLRDGARFLAALKAGVGALGQAGWRAYRPDEPQA